MHLEIPDEKQLKSIYDEFDTNEAKTKEKIKELIEWLENEPHLPAVKNEFFLRNYLMRCKNDINRARKILENYYIAKAEMSDIFTNRNMHSESFEKCSELGAFIPLPKLTPEGYRISIYRISKGVNSKMPTTTEYLKFIQIMALMSMKLDFHKKTIVVCDFNGISLSFITLLLCGVKRQLSLSTKVVPFRFHKIYILNAIPALEPLIKITKLFAKKGVADRIEIWKRKTTDLIDVLPSNILPSDYGGTERPLHELADAWFTEVKNYQTWLEEEEKDVAILSSEKKKLKKVEDGHSSTVEDEICFQDLNLD